MPDQDDGYQCGPWCALNLETFMSDPERFARLCQVDDPPCRLVLDEKRADARRAARARAEEAKAAQVVRADPEEGEVGGLKAGEAAAAVESAPVTAVAESAPMAAVVESAPVTDLLPGAAAPAPVGPSVAEAAASKGGPRPDAKERAVVWRTEALAGVRPDLLSRMKAGRRLQLLRSADSPHPSLFQAKVSI